MTKLSVYIVRGLSYAFLCLILYIFLADIGRSSWPQRGSVLHVSTQNFSNSTFDTLKNIKHNHCGLSSPITLKPSDLLNIDDTLSRHLGLTGTDDLYLNYCPASQHRETCPKSRLDWIEKQIGPLEPSASKQHLSLEPGLYTKITSIIEIFTTCLTLIFSMLSAILMVIRCIFYFTLGLTGILAIVPMQPAAKRLLIVLKDTENVIEALAIPAVVTSNVSTPRDTLPQKLISIVSGSILATIPSQVNDLDAKSETETKVISSKQHPAAVHSSDTSDAPQTNLIASETSHDQINSAISQIAKVLHPNDNRGFAEEEPDKDYATAYSFRSCGDKTTGAATVIIAPHNTLRSRQELAEAKSIVESTRTQDDVDDEAWDIIMVAEYEDEIFTHLRDMESRLLPCYLDNQAKMTWSMRAALMGWLIEVHLRANLLPETLFLCANYIDRFLSCKVVSPGKLQLVGALAIFIAAKYEEIKCLNLEEIVKIAGGAYTVEEILKAERCMLSRLQFELGWPGPMSFLRRISKADDYDLETRSMAKYFLEVTIMDERFLGSVPSYVAAGAHSLSRFILEKGDWTAAHVHYSGYTGVQLRPLVSLMMECCRNPEKHHQAVFEKYSLERYKCVAIFVKDQLDHGFVLPIDNPPISAPSIPSPNTLADVS